MGQFTNAQKAKAARRELAARQRVYPRLINAGKMSQDKATYELAIMHEIMDDYEGKCSVADMQEEMFSNETLPRL